MSTNPSFEDGAPASPPTFAELIASHSDEDGATCPPEPVSLANVLAGDQDADPMKLVAYFKSLGIVVRCLDDLLLINKDETEEELHAFKCAEGIALSVASDGIFVFFVP